VLPQSRSITQWLPPSQVAAVGSFKGAKDQTGESAKRLILERSAPRCQRFPRLGAGIPFATYRETTPRGGASTSPMDGALVVVRGLQVEALSFLPFLSFLSSPLIGSDFLVFGQSCCHYSLHFLKDLSGLVNSKHQYSSLACWATVSAIIGLGVCP
jgi:hypothetical protein